MFMPRIVLALTVALVGFTVLLVARVQGARRAFFMDLEREVTDSDRTRVRRVAIVTVVASVAGIATSLLASDPVALTLTATLIPFVPIAWMLVEIVALVRSLPAPAPASSFRVPLDAPPATMRYVSVPLQLANAGVLVIASAAFWAVRAQLPDRVPMHFDAAGRVNRWGNPNELWTMLGVMLFDYVLLWVIAWGVSKERWALPAGKEERYVAAQLRRRRLIVRMVETLMLAVNAGMAAMWLGIAVGSLPGRGELLHAGVVLSIALMAMGTVGSLVGFMGPLVRAQDELKAMGASAAFGTRASGWKWGGLVYYCPEDPALFVPKQRGIGQTLNFARPSAWVFLVFVLVVPLAIAGGGILLAGR